MWDRPNGRHFYRPSYRSAPPKLVPAIISCQSSCGLLFFGIFLLIAGSITRLMSGTDVMVGERDPLFGASHTIHPDFEKAHEEMQKGPRIAGAVLIIVGCVLIAISLIGFLIAFVLYRNYESDRRIAMMSTTGSHAFTSQAFIPSPTPAVDYPIQGGYQYEPGYRALAQNVVYNSTTEPNAKIIES